MNLTVTVNHNFPLLTYDQESNISQRNMSSLYFINYYKEPYYHEVGGIITDMYIPTFLHPNHYYLGMNYNEEEWSEEYAQDQASKMFFSQCEFHFKRKNNLHSSYAFCTADKGKYEHNNDLGVFSGLHCDTFDAWINAIKWTRENSTRFGFKIEFNQHARDVFLGGLLMKYFGDWDEDDEYLTFDLNNLEIQFSTYENFSNFQLSSPSI